MVHPHGDEESGLGNPFKFHRTSHKNTRSEEASVPLSPIGSGNFSIGHRFDERQRDSTTTEYRTGGDDDHLDLDNPQRWLWPRYGQHLVRRKPLARGKRGKKGGKGGKGFAIDFEQVQRVNLLRLRIKLVGHISRWERSHGEDLFEAGADKREKSSWDEDFHNYGKYQSPGGGTFFFFLKKKKERERKDELTSTPQTKSPSPQRLRLHPPHPQEMALHPSHIPNCIRRRRHRQTNSRNSIPRPRYDPPTRNGIQSESLLPCRHQSPECY